MEFERMEPIVLPLGMKKIENAKILVFGCGGVGGSCIEALARAGIKHLCIVDNDVISISNINRQIIALHSTLGNYKVDEMKKRILDINPLALVDALKIFYNEDTYKDIKLEEYDYIIDCIDTVCAKLYLAEYCFLHNLNLISSMGTGNKLDATKFQIGDIFKTTNDPLSRVMREGLRKRSVSKLTVISSTELPIKVDYTRYPQLTTQYKNSPASVSFVPPVAGMMMAGFVIKKIIERKD